VLIDDAHLLDDAPAEGLAALAVRRRDVDVRMVANRRPVPPEATEVCVTVANAEHGVLDPTASSAFRCSPDACFPPGVADHAEAQSWRPRTSMALPFMTSGFTSGLISSCSKLSSQRSGLISG
jgi:hypothetical protein